MPSLLIRNVDPELHARLKARAAARGRSLQAEARDALARGLTATDTKQPGLATLMHELFAPLGGLDLPDVPRDIAREPPDFSGPEYDLPDE